MKHDAPTLKDWSSSTVRVRKKALKERPSEKPRDGGRVGSGAVRVHSQNFGESWSPAESSRRRSRNGTEIQQVR